MIRITPLIAIDEREIAESFIRSSGPGGQNVNKLATAVELRFDAAHSPALDSRTLARLRRLAGRRLSAEGVLVIKAQSFRSQQRNRAEALSRLIDLIRRAASAPKPRRPTKPSKAAIERRHQAKKHRAQIKTLRQVRIAEE